MQVMTRLVLQTVLIYTSNNIYNTEMLGILTLPVLIPLNMKAKKRTPYTIIETARRAMCLYKSGNLIPFIF